MKEEILTAKEWLDTNLIKDCMLSNKEIEGMDLDGYTTCSEAMELYAKSKNKILEDRVKEFNKIINDRINMLSASSDWETVYERNALEKLIEEYDEHFNIK